MELQKLLSKNDILVVNRNMKKLSKNHWLITSVWLDGLYQKDRRYTLARMWQKEPPCTMLLWKTNIESPHKTDSRTPMWSWNPTVHVSKEMMKHLYPRVHHSTTVPEKWKQLNVHPVVDAQWKVVHEVLLSHQKCV